MAIQHITYNVGGTVYLDAPDRLSNPTIKILDGQGNTLVNGESATVNSVDTTLSAAASADDLTVTVSSATGIVTGGVYWLSSREQILVKSVSGTTVTLFRPLVYDHANGADFESHRVTYSVSSSEASQTFWFGFCEWYNNGTFYAQTSLCCTKQPLFLMTGVQDLIDHDADFLRKISPEADVNRMLDVGFQDVIRQLDSKDQARVFRASGNEFSKAIAYAVFRNHYMSKNSPEEMELYNRYDKAFQIEVALAINGLPKDTDEDGITREADETPSFFSIRLTR